MANYGMEVIDSGVAVLSMHAPYEVTSKANIYEAYRGYKSILERYKIRQRRIYVRNKEEKIKVHKK